jgi:hypothetical protein
MGNLISRPKERTSIKGCENRVLTRISGRRAEEVVTHDWRKLHNEKLHDLYYLPDIIRVIKLRTMRWKGHTARVGKMRNAYKVLVRKRNG